MIYRVEIRKDGSIASCVEVESAVKDRGRVYYVEAEDKVRACVLAKKSFERLAAGYLRIQAERQANGICKACGKNKAKPGVLQCQGCTESSTARLRERRAITRIADPELRSKMLAERAVRKKDAAKTTIRLAQQAGQAKAVAAKQALGDARWDAHTPVINPSYQQCLRQCLRAYDRDPAKFRGWLLAKLGQEDERIA